MEKILKIWLLWSQSSTFVGKYMCGHRVQSRGPVRSDRLLGRMSRGRKREKERERETERERKRERERERKREV